MILQSITLPRTYEDGLICLEGGVFLCTKYMDESKVFIGVDKTVYAVGPTTCRDASGQMFNFHPFRDAIINRKTVFSPEIDVFNSLVYNAAEYSWVPANGMLPPNPGLPIERRRELMQQSNISLSSKYSNADYKVHAPKTAPPKRLHLGLAPLFEGLQYSCEVEMTSKKIPPETLLRYGMIPLYDGSISGNEVCTHPLENAEGLALVEKCFKALAAAGEQTSSACAFHVHFSSNKVLKKAQIVALYLLYWKIYGGLMEIFPYYLTDPVGIGGKHKNYCEGPTQPFIQARKMDVEAMYDVIRKRYIGSRELSGPSHNNPARYAAINLYPHFSRNGTIEFRLHPGTLSSLRGLGWLALHAALLQMAISDPQLVIDSVAQGHKTSLFDVLGFAQSMCSNDDAILFLQMYEEQLEHDMQQRAETYAKSIDLAGDGGTSTRNRHLMNLSTEYFKTQPQI